MDRVPPPVSNEEYSSLSHSDGNLCKVLCLRCSKNFSKRTIEARLVKEHVFSKDAVRGWHAHRDAMASQNQHLANCSRFQLTWERTRNSMQAPPSLAPADGPAPPPPVLGADVPPPGDGEGSGDAASDAARFYSGLYSAPPSPEIQDEMEAEPAPPPAAGPSTDGVLQRRRWKQDTLSSEDRLVARMGQNANLYAPSCGVL